jgi:hypothetical protein
VGVGKGLPVGKEVVRKDVEESIWCRKCVHIYVNVKMIAVETTLGMGGQKSGGGNEFKYDIYDTL